MKGTGAARSLGLTLHVQDIRAADDIPAAYEAGSRARTEGVLVTEESMFIVHRARLTEFAARYKLPAVYPFLLPVTDAGGLMAYAVHAPELHRNAAAYVDRILKGMLALDRSVAPRLDRPVDLLVQV